MKGFVPLLLVKDLADFLEFYEAKLGFTREIVVPQEAPTFARLVRDGVVVELEVGAGLFKAHPQLEARFDRKEVGIGVLLMLDVEDVDKLCNEFQQKGGQLFSPTRTMPWGIREFTVSDPDGYLLAFGQRVTQR